MQPASQVKLLLQIVELPEKDYLQLELCQCHVHVQCCFNVCLFVLSDRPKWKHGDVCSFVMCFTFLILGPMLVPMAIVTQCPSLILGYMTNQWRANTRTGQTVFTIFCFQKMFKITKFVPKCFIMSVEHY